MPKALPPSLPVSGLFAVAKPSGPTSMSVVETIKKLVGSSRLFVKADTLASRAASGSSSSRRGRKHREAGVKVGQGGTLDPLADGVLVIGIGKGTKKLETLLHGVKEYRSTCLLGCETDTYDSEGKRVRLAPWKHVTPEMIHAALPQFTGEIEQTPPIFSALKMDGRPLYEYARKGIPLPRPIESRKVEVSSLTLREWLGDGHRFKWPDQALSADEQRAVEVALSGIDSGIKVDEKTEKASDDVLDPPNAEEGSTPNAFELAMTVSGGTYVRSLVHDLAHVVGSAGHVVTLTRARQGRFALEPVVETTDDMGCVPWEVFERATNDPGEQDAEGWAEWEREVIERLIIVD